MVNFGWTENPVLCSVAILPFTEWTVSKIKASMQMIALPEKERYDMIKQI